MEDISEHSINIKKTPIFNNDGELIYWKVEMSDNRNVYDMVLVPASEDINFFDVCRIYVFVASRFSADNPILKKILSFFENWKMRLQIWYLKKKLEK